MSEKKPARKTGRPVRAPGEKPTREKIFDAAVDLFAERGYDRTSVRDIARAVGITESAVYRHYPSKEAILDAIFTYQDKQVYTPLPEPAVGGAGEKTIIRQLLGGLPGAITADPYLVKISRIQLTEMHHNEKIRDHVLKGGEKAEAYTEAMFRKYMEDGVIRRCDPGALATVFNAYRFFWFYGTFLFDHGEPLDVDRMVESLRGPIELFEDLLKPEKK